jgi:release factor glutamine methyltransferase
MIKMRSVEDALYDARTMLAPTCEASRLDAELLLAYVLNCARSYLHARPEAVLSDSQKEQYTRLIKRRAAGEPLAYIRGFKEFWSLHLRVTPDVLIPRPETELLVELALARIPPQGVFEIADLGTGSGAIALAIASERLDCKFIATDISQAALAIAAGNARRLGLKNVRFVTSEWFSALRGRFHAIVSNPPYVDVADPHLSNLELQFEPRKALISGAGGLHDIEMIAQDAQSFLHPGGWIILEHGYDQGAQVRRLLERYGFREIAAAHDLAGHERAALGRCVRY